MDALSMPIRPEHVPAGDAEAGGHEILAPAQQSLPLVFASPHSGRDYPPDFVAASRLDPLSLRRSEDSFVDELFAAAPRLGAPLIRALFPRAFVDPNREPFELDPTMFEDDLPDYANTRSPRVAAGLGTIARIVASGADIYRHKLTFAEALNRIRRFYWPYHMALAGLVEHTLDRFGCCILIDCHSMPSVGGPTDNDAGRARVDAVLGDCHGAACADLVIDTVEGMLRRMGYHVARNNPYSGGFVTRHYGRPGDGVHALQIELNRCLYMDEARFVRGPALPRLAAELTEVIAALGRLEPDRLRPR
jgi:N-formylglutamate amidohydrolase